MAKKIKVVVVVEGGNIQSIFADGEGVEVVTVDYDTDGAPDGETKLVPQEYGRAFERAYVSNWGELEVNLVETQTLFELAEE